MGTETEEEAARDARNAEREEEEDEQEDGEEPVARAPKRVQRQERMVGDDREQDE